mmetsp:Transcript_24363/g.37252  ORF Transcript_24363/g.37252 Transcript_24363/m.37252 type:complete len:503 (-) Transcript_24363:1782-3290(-)
MTEGSTQRPPFDRLAFESVAPKHQTQDDENMPCFLNKLGINNTIIACAVAMKDYYYKNNGVNVPYEIPLISNSINFLQCQGDLSNPDKIREYARFFRETVKTYAVRYFDKNGKEFINASVGEIDDELYSETCDHNKVILFVTAFYTKSCLTSEKNSNPINHIEDDNHTIKYLTEKIIRNAMQCMINKEMTNDSVEDVLKKYIARADIHTRGGTVGKGNNFEGLVGELDKDSALSGFCNDFDHQFGLGEGIKLGNTSLTSCRPILIDLMLGICNISLYAAYIKAMGSKLHIYLASRRTGVVFQQRNDDDAHSFGLLQLDVANVALGLHPNSVQVNLTNRPLEDMVQLDNGITAVFQPLDRVPIKIITNGEERDTLFSAEDKSDFFQRLHCLRKGRNEEFNYDKTDIISFKLLEQAKVELDEMKKEKGKAKEEVKIIATTKAQVEHDAKSKASNEGRKRRKEATDQRRAVQNEVATNGLEALQAKITNTDEKEPSLNVKPAAKR